MNEYLFEVIEHEAYRHTVVVKAETAEQAEEIAKSFNGLENERVECAGTKYLGTDYELDRALKEPPSWYNRYRGTF